LRGLLPVKPTSQYVKAVLIIATSSFPMIVHHINAWGGDCMFALLIAIALLSHTTTMFSITTIQQRE
jgi:hypothetical protein